MRTAGFRLAKGFGLRSWEGHRGLAGHASRLTIARQSQARTWPCDHAGHMMRASVSAAKPRLSELLDRVRCGESVLIADRATPWHGSFQLGLSKGSQMGAPGARWGGPAAVGASARWGPAGALLTAKASVAEGLVRDREEGR